MDGNFRNPSTSGVRAADDVYTSDPYSVRYSDPVVDAQAACFDVQIAPKWVVARGDLFAAFFVVG